MKNQVLMIGSEADEQLISKLRGFLKKIEAKKIKETNYVTGSQDVFIYEYEIYSKPVIIETETHVGVSILSSPEIIKIFRNEFRDSYDGIESQLVYSSISSQPAG
jgi:hypothetical protein